MSKTRMESRSSVRSHLLFPLHEVRVGPKPKVKAHMLCYLHTMGAAVMCDPELDRSSRRSG